ncbi:MAG: hypothetical protein ABEJ40_05555, partial [Haloarculaceae archaeon]
GQPVGGLLSSTAVRVGLAVVLVAAIGGVAATQLGVMGGSDGAGTSDAVEQVPDGVTGVARFDPGVLDDSVATELYAEAYEATANATDRESDGGTTTTATPGMAVSPRASVPSNLTAVRERIENQTGLDPGAADEVVAFWNAPENATGEQYGGVIVHADWNESAFKRAVAESAPVRYENATVAGKRVYRPSSGGGDEDALTAPSPDWIGVLGDGEYVVGTEAAVTDAIRVSAGNESSLDGDLLSTYSETEDGYLRYAVKSPSTNVTRINETYGAFTGMNVTKYGEAYNDLYVVAGSYYTTDSGLGSETRIRTNETDTAKDVRDLIQGAISINAGAVQNETLERQLRSTEVNRDGTTVTVTRETSIEAMIEIFRWYRSIMDPEEMRMPSSVV